MYEPTQHPRAAVIDRHARLAEIRQAAQVRAILSPAYLAYVLGQAPRPHIPA